MSRMIEGEGEQGAVQAAAAAAGVAVECVVFDRADRPKRRRLIPLAALLQPVEGLVSPALRDAS